MAQYRLEVLNRHLKGTKPTFNWIQCSAKVGPVNFIDKEFRYTFNNPMLSREQRIFYEQNGYIIIPDLVDNEIIEQCKDRFTAICEGTVPLGIMNLMKDLSLKEAGAKGMYLYNKLQDFMYDEVFEKYFLNEKILDIVECFTGPDVQAIHTMFINKPPDSGKLTSRHPLHQDLYYFPLEPADRVVCAWTALEETTLDNGCLIVIPGSHTGPMLDHSYPDWEGGVNILYHGVKGYDPSTVVPLPMKRGETLFFHPLLLHGSGPNLTKGFRRSISCHYTSSNCRLLDVEGTLHENMAKEVLEIIKRKFGFEDIPFQKFWETKARKVREQGKSCA